MPDNIESQTNELFAHITGQRTSPRMAQEAQAVLRNLQGHRDRGEAIQPRTRRALQAAADSELSPWEAAERLGQVRRELARAHPAEYVQGVVEALRNGLISLEQAISFLSSQRGMESFRRQFRSQRDVDRQQLLDWTQAQRGPSEAERDFLYLYRRALGNENIEIGEESIGEEQQSEEEQQEEEEPKPVESAFDVFDGKRRRPRRVLGKLKLRKEGKEASDGQNDHHTG